MSPVLEVDLSSFIPGALLDKQVDMKYMNSHVVCICRYEISHEIYYREKESVRVYHKETNETRKTTNITIDTKFLPRHHPSHDSTFTLGLFCLCLTLLPNCINRIGHHDHFLEFFHFTIIVSEWWL
jgi:hypothetical protein